MSDLSDVLANPGLLKLELMLHGIRLPMRRSLEHGGAVTGHALFGSAGDVDLLLPGGTWASVPVMRGLMRVTPYELVEEGGVVAAQQAVQGHVFSRRPPQA